MALNSALSHFICYHNFTADTDLSFWNTFPFQIGDSCYKMPPISLVWDKAQEHCKTEHGSQLVIFETRDEAEKLKDNFPPFRQHRFWVGARKHNDGQYYWEDCHKSGLGGEESCDYTLVPQSMWNGIEPDNQRNREFWAGSGTDLRYLNDAWSSKRFVCEYHLE